MLGELVYEGRGKALGMRVLPNGKLEYTEMMQGTMLGEKFSATWSGEGDVRPDGTGYFEFWGFFMTESGAMGKYKGNGNGIHRPDGSMTYRGAVCYANPPGKFAKLNGTAVVYEIEVDKDGNFHNKGWEWK